MVRRLRMDSICWALIAVTACATHCSEAGEAGEPDVGGVDVDPNADVDTRADSESPDAEDPPTPLRVLFVGNSYTYSNNLPSMVDAIVDATTPGGAEVASVTAGGATLADHWSSTGARDAIASGEYDVVVLQGQSIEPVANTADFQDYAERFAGALGEVDARGVWFATWAPRSVEALPEMLWPALEEQYETAAAHNGDRVARVGAAWEIALIALPEVPLFVSDQSHPTPEGTLLASCVIAQAITGVDPILPEAMPLGVPNDVAESLCAIADDGVPCDPQESLCDGQCVAWSPSACGACDVTCAGEDPCRLGVCGCEPGLVGCQQRCVLLGSIEHCSGCGDACGQGQLCGEGECACQTSAALDIYDRFAEITAIEPDCAQRDDAGSLACNAAAHQYCADTGCFASGFLPAGHGPRPEAVMCVPGEVRETTFTALSEYDAACDGVEVRVGQPCATAIHRLCVSEGAISGFGPIGADGATAWVTCLSAAEVVTVTDEELQAHVSRCVPDAATCSSAAWNLCESRGHTAGFGPVEVDGTDRVVVCVD